MMDEYSIYWMKDGIAFHYFHKSGILYRFLKQYRQNKERSELKMQYDYITNHFVREDLIAHFKKFQSNQLAIRINGNNVQIERNEQAITLQIYDKHLQFRCCTLKDAEELLFPILRDFESSLFVAGNNIVNYGWISPLKSSKKYHTREVLFSSH